MKSKKLFAILCITLNLSCQSFQVSDIGPIVQLPASKKCFQVYTISKKEKEFSKEDCEKIKERAVFLTSETWKIIRRDIQTNCQIAQCKQLTGSIDYLFFSLDNALQQINGGN